MYSTLRVSITGCRDVVGWSSSVVMAGRVGRDEMEAAVGTYSEGDGGKRWSGSGCRRDNGRRQGWHGAGHATHQRCGGAKLLASTDGEDQLWTQP